MNAVLLDTDIWLDIVLDRPEKAYALGAAMACQEENIDIYICATSLKDIFYLVNHAHGQAAAYRAIHLLLEIAKLAAVDTAVCRAALGYEVPDYEDGIVTACALTEQVDAVVTRDKASFAGHAFAKYTPQEFVHALGYEEMRW